MSQVIGNPIVEHHVYIDPPLMSIVRCVVLSHFKQAVLDCTHDGPL